MRITSHLMCLIFRLAGWVQRLLLYVWGSKLINEFLPLYYNKFKQGVLAFQLVIIIFSFQIIVNAQVTDYINGNKYIKLEDKWYAVDGEDKFLVSDSIITVKWKPSISKQTAEDFNQTQGVKIIRKNVLGYVDLKVEIPGDALQIVKNYINSNLVEIAEPSTFGVFGSLQTNDTHFGKQWYLHYYPDYDINAPEAWSISTGSPSVIVSIIDSGTDWLHEDLGMGTDGYQNIYINSNDPWANPNDPSTGDSLDNDGNGFIDDYKGWNFIWGTSE